MIGKSRVQGIPRFSKAQAYATSLFKKTCIRTCFTNQKKSEDFCFYKKGQKAEVAFSICFTVSH